MLCMINAVLDENVWLFSPNKFNRSEGLFNSKWTKKEYNFHLEIKNKLSVPKNATPSILRVVTRIQPAEPGLGTGYWYQVSEMLCGQCRLVLKSHLWHADYFIISFVSPSLKFTIFHFFHSW